MFAPLALAMLLAVPNAPGPAAPPRLEGGFIQIQGWMMKLTPEDWARELAAAHAVGLDTIIIQYLQSGDHSFIPMDEDATDPTAEILKFADAHDMRVFLGTLADNGWWHWDAEYLTTSLAKRKALLKTINDRYGDHPSFAGWYFTEEVSGGLAPDRVRRLREYFRAQSDYANSLRKQPVAFAPFFSDLTPLEDMRSLYDELLDGAGIDIMMVQDGVGARGWDANLEEKVVPFFRMFAEVCERHEVALWCDLESFRRKVPAKETGFLPTDPERLARQLKAVAPFVEKIVTFDFFHYMSPHRGEAQRTLYDGYRDYLQHPPAR